MGQHEEDVTPLQLKHFLVVSRRTYPPCGPPEHLQIPSARPFLPAVNQWYPCNNLCATRAFGSRNGCSLSVSFSSKRPSSYFTSASFQQGASASQDGPSGSTRCCGQLASPSQHYSSASQYHTSGTSRSKAATVSRIHSLLLVLRAVSCPVLAISSYSACPSLSWFA